MRQWAVSAPKGIARQARRPANGRPGAVLHARQRFKKEAEAAVFFSVDGSEPKPLPADPHNRPLVSDLALSRHAITIVVKPYATDKQGDSLPVVKIHSIGAAGVASDLPVANE